MIPRQLSIRARTMQPIAQRFGLVEDRDLA
jgi:hypothetical protein